MSAVCTPSGAQRNSKLQSANNAVQDYTEQRKWLHTLQGAMKHAVWLPVGHMPDFPLVHHNPRDRGPLHLSRPSGHCFVVGLDPESEETWIVHPLLLPPVQDLSVSF